MANAMRLRPAGKKASQAASQPANGSNGAHCQQPNANPDSDADADSMLMQTHSQPASGNSGATGASPTRNAESEQRGSFPRCLFLLAAFHSDRIDSTSLAFPPLNSTRLAGEPPANDSLPAPRAAMQLLASSKPRTWRNQLETRSSQLARSLAASPSRQPAIGSQLIFLAADAAN